MCIPRKIQVTGGTFHGTLYYLLPCHRKVVHRQYSKCNIRVAHGGEVVCNIVESITAVLYSDWLDFLWLGINAQYAMPPRGNTPSGLIVRGGEKY